MMNLVTMAKVVRTVDGEWKSTLAEEILERWGYDRGTVFYYRASSNFLFVFKKAGKRYFLRFSDSNEKAYSQIESEMNILEYLRDQPICVALPVRSNNGNLIECIEVDIGTYYAVVFEALPGKQLEIEELEEDDFHAWGNHLGRLHKIFKEMPAEYRSGRKDVQDQLDDVFKNIPDYETAALKEFDAIKHWVGALGRSNENFGVIHYDFELDNLIWQDGEIGILDFDDCMNNWFVADIAYALRDILKTRDDMENPFVHAFIAGYQSETQLDQLLVKELPMFIRMHNLFTFVSLLRIIDVPESMDLPEGLINLKEKLKQYIEKYRNSFSS
ncbi:phosphotransferase enzyme family protein [Mesobacillus subterraneus]|uniref:phosphotransferase enzyme family protein n=1 Tax=Mesobacillus subterraneus TaxID=285983 RepID=UPI001CFF3A64|nr:phosphotransferase [Mesobacillus subterraneus]